ncbi:unnamed protein product, partial [Rotaria socialis]
MDEYAPSLHSDTETSVSMVRDVRTRVFDDASILSRNNHDNIPIKVDVE